MLSDSQIELELVAYHVTLLALGDLYRAGGDSSAIATEAQRCADALMFDRFESLRVSCLN